MYVAAAEAAVSAQVQKILYEVWRHAEELAVRNLERMWFCLEKHYREKSTPTPDKTQP